MDTGRRKFRMLVEAKTKNARLDEAQVVRYLELARDNGIDAVLTISNQFTATPGHSPVDVPSRLLKKVALYHLSWAFIKTNIDLLLGGERILDADRVLVMRELQRYLAHESSGISGFTQMNKDWRNVVKQFSAGAKLAKNDEELLGTVNAWHQEQKDMCLILSRRLQTPVALKMSRKHLENSEEWEKATIENLLETNCLVAEIDVPDAAAPIIVRANLARKTLTFSMRVKAPADKKSTKARTNWLLRQISAEADPRLQIRLHYPGRKPHQTIDIAELRENVDLANIGGGAEANYLEVRLFDDLGGRFSGSKTFIESIEKCLEIFYDQAVMNIKPWQPSAPKVVQELSGLDQAEIPSAIGEPGDLN